jgi:hypothetical protein
MLIDNLRFSKTMKYTLIAFTTLAATLISQAAFGQTAPRPGISSSVSVIDFTGNSRTTTNFWGEFENLEVAIQAGATARLANLNLDAVSAAGLAGFEVTTETGGYNGQTISRQQFTGRSVIGESNF